MRKDKQKAIALRRSGRSYRYIEEKLGIPKGTLAGWFRNVRWSAVVKRRLTALVKPHWRENMRRIAIARANHWRERRATARAEARKQFSSLAREPLFGAGLMLYWGEGDKGKKGGSLRIGNTDPGILSLFSAFLQRYCGILKEKIRMSLLIYPDLDDRQCKQHWSRSTNIPLSQFYQSTTIRGRHPTRRLSFGIGIMQVTSCERKEKVLEWIGLYHKFALRYTASAARV